MDGGNGSGRTEILTLCAPGCIAEEVPQILIYSYTRVKTGNQCPLEQPLCKNGHLSLPQYWQLYYALIFTFHVAQVYDQFEC